MTINNIVELSKAFRNSHRINKTSNTILIEVSKKNKWKLLVIGLIAVLIPTLLNNFIPIETESDISFFNKMRLICYTLPILLAVVYFLQNKQKTEIQTVTKVITHKNQIIKPEEVIDFEVEHLRKRQLNVFSIYLTTKFKQKILIGATTSSQDKMAMEKYAKAMLSYIKS